MDIGKKLKKARLELKMQQKHVVEKYNIISADINYNKTITNSTLSNWENNVYQPDPDSIAILCNILNINANDLLEIDKVKRDKYCKTILLDDGNSVAIFTNEVWNNIPIIEKMKLLDSIIEEVIKLKKEK